LPARAGRLIDDGLIDATQAATSNGRVIAPMHSEVNMAHSHDDFAVRDQDDELPPGQPVIGNDTLAEPGDEEPLDNAPVPTLTEPGDTNGG
jgi:hypothetical protein